MYANCLLIYMPTKHNKYVVNQKLEHFDDISFSNAKLNAIPSEDKAFVSTLAIIFHETQLD